MNLESKDKASSSFQKDLVWRFSGLKYMMRLIDHYGIDIVKKGKNRYYSPEPKQEMINKVLLEGYSRLSVSLDYALPNQGMHSNWLTQYRKKRVYYC